MAAMSDNMRGAFLMMASMAAFTFNDACVKAIGASLPLFQIIALRGMLTIVLVYALARYLGVLRFDFPRRDWVIVLVRLLGEVGATFFFLSALMQMPIANLTAVLQVLPLTVTLAGAVFLGEKVGIRRLTAILIGFCGMLLIVRPGPEGFDTYMLYGLAAVGFVTLRDIMTRRLSKDVPSLSVTLTTAIGVTLFALVASIGTAWQPVGAHDAMLLVTSSVFILGGYLFAVMVMRVGEMGFVAPFRYTGLLWALLLGFVVFGEWPDLLTMLGAAIVVATGIFTLWREAKLSQPKT